MIEIKELTKTYNSGEAKVNALRGITETIKDGENILLPLIIAQKAPDMEYFNELAATLGLEEKLVSFPNQLSGGQKQRVAIGRAMIHKPSVILADEPTGNLDQATSKEILDLLLKCSSEYNQTLVIVTHDKEVAS